MLAVLILRAIGVILVVVGQTFALFPTLAFDPGPAPDLFEAVERHARWGLAIGVGAFLIARTHPRPWKVAVASAIQWLSLGYLIARVTGMVLEGAGSQRQWVACGVELAVGLAAIAFLRYRSGPSASAAKEQAGPPSPSE